MEVGHDLVDGWTYEVSKQATRGYFLYCSMY